MKWPKNILMVSPTGFEVTYAINPHMLDAEGNLNKVNKSLAVEQWSSLKKTFENLGLNTHVIEGPEKLPDMVFTANQTFPFLKTGKTQIALSTMNSKERQPEVQFFKEWALKNNIETYHLKNGKTFEGMGDTLWNYESEEVFGGHGFRTEPEVYDELEKLIEAPIHRLKLISEDFYHLDTCLAVAGKNTAFVVREGFDQASFELLKTKFSDLIEIPFEEAKNGFAANLCCVNGEDIIIQKGNLKTATMAVERGFKVHEAETSEYMKSGGSVFCMKQLFW